MEKDKRTEHSSTVFDQSEPYPSLEQESNLLQVESASLIDCHPDDAIGRGDIESVDDFFADSEVIFIPMTKSGTEFDSTSPLRSMFTMRNRWQVEILPLGHQHEKEIWFSWTTAKQWFTPGEVLESSIIGMESFIAMGLT